MLVITVTYGTNPHQIFAEAPDMETAEALKRCAIERKYHDAKIVLKADHMREHGIGRRDPKRASAKR